ncbi:MAG: efflux RND transporter periplasmic adaptor subunit [Candidatus Kryptoniota bacterium]
MKKKTSILLILLALSAFICGCAKSNGQPYDEPTVMKDGTIQLPQNMNTNVELAQPTRMRVMHVASLLGKVDFDPNLVTNVFSLVDGVTTRILVNQGDAIRKGQLLADVYSGDYAAVVSDFQKSSSQLETVEKEFRRAQELAESSIVSQKDLQQASNDLQQAKADYDRALKSLEVLGGNDKSTGAMYEVTSPIAGVVLERSAQPGAAVRNDGNQPLFVVGSTKNVWIKLDVYQSHLADVAVGDSVQLTFDGEPRPIVTTIKYISPVIDEGTLTTKARCELSNFTGLLKPEMFCTAKVFQYGKRALFIPASSEFYGSDGNSYVFVKIVDGTYRKEQVKLGQITGNLVEVTAGLRPDDLIVSNVPLLLNSKLELAGQ